MCVGRYAAKVMRNERSEMEHNRSEMPANIAGQISIPAGCDFTINCGGGVKKRFARVRKKLYLCIAFREMLPDSSVRDIAQSG